MLVILPCFELYRSNSFHVNTQLVIQVIVDSLISMVPSLTLS